MHSYLIVYKSLLTDTIHNIIHNSDGEPNLNLINAQIREEKKQYTRDIVILNIIPIKVY